MVAPGFLGRGPMHSWKNETDEVLGSETQKETEKTLAASSKPTRMYTDGGGSPANPVRTDTGWGAASAAPTDRTLVLNGPVRNQSKYPTTRQMIPQTQCNFMLALKIKLLSVIILKYVHFWAEVRSLFL